MDDHELKKKKIKKIGKVLLEESGIETEILPCLFVGNGNGHVILRCKIDNKWIYCDLTNINTVGYTEAIVPYSKIVNSYDFIGFYG